MGCQIPGWWDEDGVNERLLAIVMKVRKVIIPPFEV